MYSEWRIVQIAAKIAAQIAQVGEDYANEYLDNVKSTTEAELQTKADECESIKSEMDALKAELYTKFGSSINLENK